MDLIEDVDYTRTGWRAGQIATSDNEPRIIRLDVPGLRADYSVWHAHVIAVSSFRSAVEAAYRAELSDEAKAELAAAREAEMMAEAQAFYASRPAGSQRSFWD